MSTKPEPAIDPWLAEARDPYRSGSLSCHGYTLSVCAALTCMVSAYTGKTVAEIGPLTGEQLWALAVAGSRATHCIPDLPTAVSQNLSFGEHLALKLGLTLHLGTLPTGHLGDMSDGCGVEAAQVTEILFGDWVRAYQADPHFMDAPDQQYAKTKLDTELSLR